MLRLKIPPPLIALIFAALMWLISLYTPIISLSENSKSFVIFLCIFIGLTFDIFALVNFRQAKTTINPLQPEKTIQLVTNGIYQYSRNPMYVGLTFFLLAWAIYLLAPANIIMILLFVLLINELQIKPEEQALLKKFGQDYIQYQQKVRRWV